MLEPKRAWLPLSQQLCFVLRIIFIAPVIDLRRALVAGSLKSLNPFPWPFMTGNCLGWVVYAYYSSDPFVLAANVPGLLVSLWLNMGAAKLQYSERRRKRSRFLRGDFNEEQHQQQPGREGDGLIQTASEENHHDEMSRPVLPIVSSVSVPGVTEGESVREFLMTDSDRSTTAISPDETDDDLYVLVPQERTLFQVLLFWTGIVTLVGWMIPKMTRHAALQVVGYVVNANMVVFLGAPLSTAWQVIQLGHSNSIHRPTLFMNYANTTFWILYGMFGIRDVMIVFPNAVGLTLGLIQGVLCLCYPRRIENDPPFPVNTTTDDDGPSTS